jgi:N-terminal half of MaoC dehydratase
MNVALEGKSYPSTTLVVDEGAVESFRAAVGDRSTGVPPTFPTVAEFTAFPAIVGDPELELDFSRVVHTDQEYDTRRPLVVGESLTVRSAIASARSRGGNAFLTIRTELVDGAGQVVVTALATMLERASS